MDTVFKLRSVVLTLMLLLVASASKAATLSCEGCDYWAYEQTALSAGIGDHYVVDVRNNQLNRFLVRPPSAGEPWEATPAAIDPWTQELFEKVELALRLNGYAKSIRVDVNTDGEFFPGGFGHGNAYDIAYNGTLRTQLGAALANRFASSSAMLGNVVNAMWAALSGGASALGQELSITLVIHWSDGSRSEFKLDKENLGTAAFVLGQSIDSDGNLIPDAGAATDEGADRYLGIWDFNSRDNVDRWIRNAAIFGIPVGSDRSAGSRMTCGVTCEGVEGACRITCTRR